MTDFNQAQPFLCSVPFSLEENCVVTVHGTVDSKPEDFYVGLQVGEPVDKDSDIALLFKPILDGSTQLVCSSFINEANKGEQTNEEQLLYLPVFPFREGQEFVITILVKKSVYQITVDDRHIVDFSHRISPSNVTHVTLDGDAIFRTVSFQDKFGSEQFYSVDNESGSRQKRSHNNKASSMFTKGKGEKISDQDFETSITKELTTYTFKSEGRDSHKSLDVPYFQMLPSLVPGKVIYVDGVVKQDAKRLIVSLQTDVNLLPNSTSALYIHPDFEKKKVICNSFALKTWGEEVIKDDFFPFEHGRPFLMKILTTEDGFQLFINGSLFMTFQHRVSFERITHIMVDGDTELHTVECPDDLDLPYKNGIPGGLHVGKAIIIEGKPWKETDSNGPTPPNGNTVEIGDGESSDEDDEEQDDGKKLQNVLSSLLDNDQSFHINLQTNGNDYPETTVALQLKVITRFGSKKIICNSYIKGIWGNEEVVFGDLPFNEDKKFIMRITVQEEVFQIKLNEDTNFVYKHRLPIDEITYISIDGDLTLDNVSYRNRWHRGTPDKISYLFHVLCPCCRCPCNIV